jgi:hypothetical protein
MMLIRWFLHANESSDRGELRRPRVGRVRMSIERANDRALLR